MSDELLELADRCEAASGPDRAIDGAIREALGLPDRHRIANGMVIDGYGFGTPIPEYTASLDAAMTLVDLDQGFDLIGPMQGSGLWQAGCGEDGREQADAATPALALCAASLRARASRLRMEVE